MRFLSEFSGERESVGLAELVFIPASENNAKDCVFHWYGTLWVARFRYASLPGLPLSHSPVQLLAAESSSCPSREESTIALYALLLQHAVVLTQKV